MAELTSAFKDTIPPFFTLNAYCKTHVFPTNAFTTTGNTVASKVASKPPVASTVGVVPYNVSSAIVPSKSLSKVRSTWFAVVLFIEYSIPGAVIDYSGILVALEENKDVLLNWVISSSH